MSNLVLLISALVIVVGLVLIIAISGRSAPRRSQEPIKYNRRPKTREQREHDQEMNEHNHG